MNKYIYSILVFFLVFELQSYAQNNILSENKAQTTVNGYYQTINLDNETPCNCNEKTQRTYDLAKGLRPSDLREYELHTYKFKFGSSTIPASKLFKALENDASVYKVSIKEWDSFLLLTTKEFDVLSFEAAAMKIFDLFSLMKPEDFLKTKNMDSYNEYLKKLEKESAQPQSETH